MSYSFEEFNAISKNSNVLKLLNKSEVLYFFRREFIDTNLEVVPEVELIRHWTSYQSKFLETTVKSADEYINEWIGQFWLERSRDPVDGVSKCKLLPEARKAINIMDDLMVGRMDVNQAVIAASAFETIMEKVDLIVGTNRKTVEEQNAYFDSQIERLRIELKKLQGKKAILKRGGTVEIMGPAKTKEQFLMVIRLLKGLPVDVSVIARNLHDLYVRLYDRIQNDESTKGEIMDAWIEGRTEIEQTMQGQTFKTFFEFISDDDRVRKLIEDLRSLQKNPYLHEEAKKEKPWILLRGVRESARNAHDEIDRIYKLFTSYLASASFEQDREIRKLLSKILSLQMELKNDTDISNVRLELAGTKEIIGKPLLPFSHIAAPLDIQPNMEESFIQPVVETEGDAFSVPELVDDSANVFQLRNNLMEMTNNGKSVLLSDVIKKYPFGKAGGAEDILTYLSLKDFITYSIEGQEVCLDLHNGYHNVMERFSFDDVDISRRRPSDADV